MIRIALLSLLAMGALAETSRSAAPKGPAESDIMVSVNGTPVRRKQVSDRAWELSATAALNELVDDILIEQAAKGAGVKADAAEVEVRLARVRSQFPDEATFKTRLEQQGTTLEAFKAQLQKETLREALVVKAKAIQVTDAEVRAFFEENKARLGTPEAVRLRHILVASEKEAGDFLVAVKVGADFSNLASQVSLDRTTKDKGGDLGYLAKGMLLPEIEKAAWSLKPGEVGGPVKSPQGYHLLRVDEVRPAKDSEFAEISERIRLAVLADKIGRAWRPYVQELREKAKLVPGAGPEPAKKG